MKQDLLKLQTISILWIPYRKKFTAEKISQKCVFPVVFSVIIINDQWCVIESHREATQCDKDVSNRWSNSCVMLMSPIGISTKGFYRTTNSIELSLYLIRKSLFMEIHFFGVPSRPPLCIEGDTWWILPAPTRPTTLPSYTPHERLPTHMGWMPNPPYWPELFPWWIYPVTRAPRRYRWRWQTHSLSFNYAWPLWTSMRNGRVNKWSFVLVTSPGQSS